MPEQAKHIISSYDAALYGLRNDVLMMSSLTDRLLQTAFEAFLTRNSELCDQVIAEDEEIDTLEKQVDQDGVGLLIRFHPVATDMRQVVSAMKVSTNLERIGDQSVTIARRAKRLNLRPLVSEVALLEPAYRQALVIFRDSIRAFPKAIALSRRRSSPATRSWTRLRLISVKSLWPELLQTRKMCPVTWTSSSSLSESGTMQQTLPRIHSGAIKPPTFDTPMPGTDSPCCKPVAAPWRQSHCSARKASMLLLCLAPSQSQVASPLRWPSCIQAGCTIQLAELDGTFPPGNRRKSAGPIRLPGKQGDNQC